VVGPDNARIARVAPRVNTERDVTLVAQVQEGALHATRVVLDHTPLDVAVEMEEVARVARFAPRVTTEVDVVV
jgi:hypothetical protein